MKKLKELKVNLSELRVAQVTGSAPSKLAQIRDVRKSIAVLLTVYNQRRALAIRKKFKNAKHLPKDLRPKKTRAIRRQLKRSELTMPATAPPQNEKSGKPTKKRVPRVVPKIAKRAANFPVRKYALKAA